MLQTKQVDSGSMTSGAQTEALGFLMALPLETVDDIQARNKFNV